jgi:hypothetical protein
LKIYEDQVEKPYPSRVISIMILPKQQGNPEPEDFSTWMGFEVKPSNDYPDKVFVAATEYGLAAMEACYQGVYWAAKIRIEDKFVGQAMSIDRSTARREAERKLADELARRPDVLAVMVLTDLLALLNPALITGDTTCLNLN